MSNYHIINDNKKWRDFFDCYRSLPALWDATTEEYKNKYKKCIAYEKLLNVYQKIEPGADIRSLKYRILNIRSCYKRELNKIQSSEYATPDDIYIPKLWYFNTLDFLRNQNCDIKRKRSSANVKENTDEHETIHEDSIDITYEDILPTEEVYLEKSNEYEARPSVTKKKRTIEKCMEDRNNLLRDALGQLKKDSTEKLSDEAYVYALGWAASYRKLDEAQKLYAKKAIEDIFIMGQLNELHYDTVQRPNDF